MSNEDTKPIEQEQQKQQPEIVKILDLAALESECKKPMVCNVTMSGKQYAIECNRLTPAQYSEVEKIEVSAIPPLIVVGDPKEGKKEYDYKDVKYLLQCKENAMAAMCYAVYHGCALFNKEKPGLTNAHDIKAFVSSKLTYQILEHIAKTILSADTALEAVVNFS